MLNLTPQEKIIIFKNLFRGREDVFAIYWEKADKSASGYTPYDYRDIKISYLEKFYKKRKKYYKKHFFSNLGRWSGRKVDL